MLTFGAVIDGRGRAEDEVAADLRHWCRLCRLEVLSATESLKLLTEVLRLVIRVLHDRMTGHSRHQDNLPANHITHTVHDVT